MPKKDDSLPPITSAAERRSGAPIGPPEPAPGPAAAAPAPSDDASYGYTNRRRRPEPDRNGLVKTSMSFPAPTRRALEQARIDMGMVPISELVNRAVVDWLRGHGYEL